MAIAKAEGRSMIFNKKDDWYNTDGYKYEREACILAAKAAIKIIVR